MTGLQMLSCFLCVATPANFPCSQPSDVSTTYIFSCPFKKRSFVTPVTVGIKYRLLSMHQSPFVIGVLHLSSASLPHCHFLSVMQTWYTSLSLPKHSSLSCLLPFILLYIVLVFPLHRTLKSSENFSGYQRSHLSLLQLSSPAKAC